MKNSILPAVLLLLAGCTFHQKPYTYEPLTLKGAECLNKCTHRKSSCRESRYTQGRCQATLNQCRTTCEQIDAFHAAEDEK